MPKRKADTSIVVDFAKLTVALLKKECQNRKLDFTGRKADLVQRLEDFEKQNGSANSKKKTADEVDEKLTMKDQLKVLAEKEKQKNKCKTYKVDSNCSLYSSQVVEDYDCMLNQTNIGNNNNKFYVIQLLNDGNGHYVFNRWGRVGEVGMTALKGPFDFESAEKEFKKKFKDKTKNNWDDRSDFKPASGKYTMIEMDTQDSQDIEMMEEKLSGLDSVDGPSKVTTKPCSLPKPTQDLMKLIFDNDMFKEAMVKLNLDVKKMPLGKLSKSQIAKGFEVLEEIETLLKTKPSRIQTSLQEETSKFFTLIPHNFGRNRPPVIGDLETLQIKMDMLAVLGDIVIAQSLKKEIKEEGGETTEKAHPIDINYGLLNCSITHLDPKTDTYKIIKTYADKTKASYGTNKLVDVWQVDRVGEGERFDEHKDITHRKLLWHGTNVAVVVAILKSGLRIMPHSGGRVGRGIYFASEQMKSASYAGGSSDGSYIMFLNEVVLGEQHVIHQDDSSLRKPPPGFDSVLAQGRTEPNPKDDVKMEMDGNDVIVPQGKPCQVKEANDSFFSQSEYLIYKESQTRIRYILRFKS